MRKVFLAKGLFEICRIEEILAIIYLAFLVLMWVSRDPGFPGWGMLFKPDFVTDSQPGLLIMFLIVVTPLLPLVPKEIECLEDEESSDNETSQVNSESEVNMASNEKSGEMKDKTPELPKTQEIHGILRQKSSSSPEEIKNNADGNLNMAFENNSEISNGEPLPSPKVKFMRDMSLEMPQVKDETLANFKISNEKAVQVNLVKKSRFHKMSMQQIITIIVLN